jgi:hypothetical protein
LYVLAKEGTTLLLTLERANFFKSTEDHLRLVNSIIRRYRLWINATTSENLRWVKHK